jgi:hypothetical protein
MREFNVVLKTPDGCTVRELGCNSSSTAAPPKPLQEFKCSAQGLLDFMFSAEGAGSMFYSEPDKA